MREQERELPRVGSGEAAWERQFPLSTALGKGSSGHNRLSFFAPECCVASAIATQQGSFLIQGRGSFCSRGAPFAPEVSESLPSCREQGYGLTIQWTGRGGGRWRDREEGRDEEEGIETARERERVCVREREGRREEERLVFYRLTTSASTAPRRKKEGERDLVSFRGSCRSITKWPRKVDVRLPEKGN